MKAQMFNNDFWIKGCSNIDIVNKFKKILEKSGFTILGFQDHYFEPQGYTALILLAESHLAIHTFPEENKTYIGLASCNKEMFDNFGMYLSVWEDEKLLTIVI